MWHPGFNVSRLRAFVMSRLWISESVCDQAHDEIIGLTEHLAEAYLLDAPPGAPATVAEAHDHDDETWKFRLLLDDAPYEFDHLIETCVRRGRAARRG